MTGGGRHEITLSTCSCTLPESGLSEDTVYPKLDTQRQAIVDTNNSLDRVIIEDTSEWLEGISKLCAIQETSLSGEG
jgi:hypothetical protein